MALVPLRFHQREVGGARIILLLALLDVKDVVLQSLILEIQIVDGGTYFLYGVLFASITTIG